MLILNKKTKFKLNFELVPDGCWYSNLRHFLSKKDWDRIRFDAYKRANGKCMICGRNTTRLEAHEKWSYDTKRGVQKLEDVVAICHDCHSVIHIGLTQFRGNEDRAIKHFLRVNDCTYFEYIEQLKEANIINNERNKVSDWVQNIKWLTDRYGEIKWKL